MLTPILDRENNKHKETKIIFKKLLPVIVFKLPNRNQY